jgi:hypothetical protein
VEVIAAVSTGVLVFVVVAVAVFEGDAMPLSPEAYK